MLMKNNTERERVNCPDFYQCADGIAYDWLRVESFHSLTASQPTDIRRNLAVHTTSLHRRLLNHASSLHTLLIDRSSLRLCKYLRVPDPATHGTGKPTDIALDTRALVAIRDRGILLAPLIVK